MSEARCRFDPRFDPKDLCLSHGGKRVIDPEWGGEMFCDRSPVVGGIPDTLRHDQRDALPDIAVQMAVESGEPVTEAEAIRRLLDLGIKAYRKKGKK